MACKAEVHISCMQKFALYQKVWKRSCRSNTPWSERREWADGGFGGDQLNLCTAAQQIEICGACFDSQLAPRPVAQQAETLLRAASWELRASRKKVRKFVHTCAKNAFKNFDAFSRFKLFLFFFVYTLFLVDLGCVGAGWRKCSVLV